MTIAIVGGTGFLGPEIARRLLARGVTPLVIARGKHPVALPDGAIFAAADRMDSAALIALFKSHAVTAVIDVFSLSLRNTQPVLDAVATTGARYVLVSSTDVYSNYEGLIKKATPPIRLAPATEDSPLRTIRYPYRANTRRPQGVEDDLFEDYDKLPIEDAARADRRFVPTIIRAPMICGIDFFGADHVLFASDCPFDKEKGPGYIRSTIAVIESLDLSPEDREKICHKNAIKMFGLKG